MKTIHLLFLSLFVLLSSFSSYASEDDQEVTTSHVSISQHGNKIKALIRRYRNINGEMEIRIEAETFGSIFSKLNPILGYARDIDGDGCPDIWFVNTRNGISQAIYWQSNQNDGSDVLFELLNKQYKTTAYMYASTIYISFAKFFSFAISNTEASLLDYIYEQMDLMDLEYRLKLAKEGGFKVLTQEQYAFQLQVLSESWQENIDKLNSATHNQFFALGAADILFTALIGKFIKWIGPEAEGLLTRMGVIEALKSSEGMIGAIVEKSTTIGKAAIDRIGIEKINIFSETSIDATLALIPKGKIYSKLAHESLKAFIQKSAFAQFFSATLKGALAEWKYIAITQSTQLVIEMMDKDTFDKDPIIMAKKTLSNKDLIQDMAYMTNETVLMAGVHSSVKNKKSALGICAIIAAVDSNVMNIAIKHELNPERVAADSGWEIIAGNIQTAIDINSLQFFEKLAEKNKNPKLKLLGYGVAFIDQGLGYWAYGKLSNKVNEDTKEREARKLKLKLIPIYGPK